MLAIAGRAGSVWRPSDIGEQASACERMHRTAESPPELAPTTYDMILCSYYALEPLPAQSEQKERWTVSSRPRCSVSTTRYSVLHILLCILYGSTANAATGQAPEIEIVAKPPGQNHVFVLGQTIPFAVTLKNTSEKVRTEEVSLVLRGYFGDVTELFKKDVTLEPLKPVEIAVEWKPETTGHFTPTYRIGQTEKPELPVGVVPPPAEGAKPLSIFGISGELSHDPREWELFRLMGIKWARGDMAWPHFQKTKDEWKGAYDDVVRMAHQQGIGIMATPGYTGNFAAQEFEWSNDFGPPPRWVVARHTAPVRPECLRDWEKYCYKLAAGYKDVVKYWEIWNEADLNFYYGTPGEYMAMHKAAWCAIKKADPDAVILGGNSCVCPYFMRCVAPDGFFAYTDAMAVHYPFSFDTPIEFDRSVAGYAKPNLEITGYAKPLEMTEGGNLIYEGRGAPFGIEDASHKTRILVKEHILNCRQQQGKFYQFTFKKGWDMGWGFMPDGLPCPFASFVSHAVMAHVLEDAEYVGQLDMGPEVSAYVFAKTMNPLTVLWKGSYIVPAGAGDVEFDAGADGLIRIDLMGRRSKLKGKAPTLHLDQEPIYVLGGDRRLVARALVERAKPILADLRRVVAKTVRPTASATQDLSVPAFVEKICKEAEQKGKLLARLDYKQFQIEYRSPLERPEIAKMLEAAHASGSPIPVYNVLHKLCDLTEVLWLEAGVACDLGKGRFALRVPSLERTARKLAEIREQVRTACGTASQPRVSDMLARARHALDLAGRAIQLNNGRVDSLAVAHLGFADDLASTALVLSKSEPKLVLNVFLTLDLPTSLHWGGRWEKKLLQKPLGEPLPFPAVATVCNRLPSRAAGTLELDHPAGWTVSPAAIPFDVGPDEDKSYTFNVTVPADNPFLPYESELRLQGISGKDRLFPATQQVEVVPPLLVQVVPADAKLVDVRSADQVMDITGAKVAVVGGSGKIGQSDITVQLLNRDKRTWAGTVRLELPPAWAAKPKDASFPAVEHYRKSEVKFTVFYPSDTKLGPQYPILARAFSGDGKLIGLGVTNSGGEWRFKVGNDPTWKDKDLDDSAWEPKQAEYYSKPGYVGDVWFRQKMFVPESWGQNDLLLNAGTVCMAAEVFFNGEKVGQFGAWPPEWQHAWGELANCLVKKDIVKRGDWNTVAVRTFVPGSFGGITPGFLIPVR